MKFENSLIRVVFAIHPIESSVFHQALFGKELVLSSKMKIFALIFASLFLNSCWSYQVIRELRKQINDGEILGRYTTSETGRTVQAFIGIPFASPPVGDFRFRAPQKVTPWNGTLLTQNQRSKCPQIDTFAGATVFEGDEDCLYVNVYVPETTSNTRLDVIVWIHGGVVLILKRKFITLYATHYLSGFHIR